MWITIIADASYCPETGVGGYGYWISSQRGKQGGDGAFKTTVVNNIAAEMQALLNGLHDAVKLGLVQPGDHVLMQSDCQAALDAFDNKRNRITREEEALVAWLREFLDNHMLRIKLRHVKGHTKGHDSRSQVNIICDRKARDNMRIARGHYKLNNLRKSLT